jgi:hypothetical protein
MYGRTRTHAAVLEHKRAGGRAQNWGAKALANAARNYAYLLGLTNCSRPVGDPVGDRCRRRRGRRRRLC